MIASLLLLVLGALSDSAQSCDCQEFRHLSWDFEQITDISIKDSTNLYAFVYEIDAHSCKEFEAHWEILRADGETEIYTIVNDVYPHGRYKNLPERELSVESFCYGVCDLYITLSPTDMRYSGAQVTGVFRLPECFNSPNRTITTTLRIQEERVETVDVESVTVSGTSPVTPDAMRPSPNQQATNDTSALTGLLALLSLPVVVVVSAVVIFLVRKRYSTNSTIKSAKNTLPKNEVADTTTNAALCEKTALPPSTSDVDASNVHEHAELKPVTGYGTDIEVAPVA
jgi:hypothetical protein